jgi:hypothetical protein
LALRRWIRPLHAGSFSDVPRRDARRAPRDGIEGDPRRRSVGVIRQKFSGGARAAAALFGTRIAAGTKDDRPASGDRKPPDWIAELDDEEGIDEFELAMRSGLDEALEERIGEPVVSRRRFADPIVERSR